jgi:polyisoprenyl-phosphate glycosyltransferase
MVEKNKIEISIVILCYRSNEQIIQFIEKIKSELEKGRIGKYELILVANYFENSGDRTPSIVKKLENNDKRIKVISEKKMGMMGWDVQTGLKAATGDTIVLIDGDGQMPPKDIVRLYTVFKSGEFDFVKTYRIIRYDGFYRKTTSIIFNIFFKILFPSIPYRDINSKPKLWTRAALDKINLNCNGWFIDGEMVLEANYHQLIFAEIPTEFYENEWRGSFVKIQTIFEMIFMMFYYRINYWLK